MLAAKRQHAPVAVSGAGAHTRCLFLHVGCSVLSTVSQGAGPFVLEHLRGCSERSANALRVQDIVRGRWTACTTYAADRDVPPPTLHAPSCMGVSTDRYRELIMAKTLSADYEIVRAGHPCALFLDLEFSKARAGCGIVQARNTVPTSTVRPTGLLRAADPS